MHNSHSASSEDSTTGEKSIQPRPKSSASLAYDSTSEADGASKQDTELCKQERLMRDQLEQGYEDKKLKELSAIHATLKEKLQIELKVQETELINKLRHSFNQELQAKDEEAQKAHANAQKALAAHDTKNHELKALTVTVETANARIQDLKTRLVSTEQHLQSCKDDLYHLQPIDQVPDDSIVQAFESFCRTVADWIEDEVTIFEDRHENASSSVLFSAGENDKYCNWMKTCPNFGEYIVRHTIHCFLQKHIFGKEIYLVGLASQTKKLLQEAEEGMSTLQPPRGSSAKSSDFKVFSD